MENLGVFGKSFQENLCRLLLYDRPFCDQIKEVLDVGFFELKYLQLFTKKLFNYKDKYQVHPSNEALTSIFRSELEDEKRREYEHMLNLLGLTSETFNDEWDDETDRKS